MTQNLSTNATHVLDRMGVAYAVAEFAAADLTAEEVCEKLGELPENVFKTLVARGDRTGLLAAVVPTGTRLSTRKLARISGNKSVSLVAPEDLEKLTGYVKGGCSPFGMRKALALFVHESVRERSRMLCSAGRRGVQLVMTGEAFLAASGATAADIVE